MTFALGKLGIPFGKAKAGTGGAGLEYRIVTELPEVGETGVIYLVPLDDPQETDMYTEWIWLEEESRYESLGQTHFEIPQATSELRGGLKLGAGLVYNAGSDQVDVESYKFLSVERLGAYVCRATYDMLAEYADSNIEVVPGACTSFVKDGKLYRNFDWKYDNTITFDVICPNFRGTAYIPSLFDGAVNPKLVEQLPYHVVDGVNDKGIKVSTHVLYNDWEYAGAGDKDESIKLLPYFILNNLVSMANISSVLSDYLSNIKITEDLIGAEYLLQFIVTDGTTTYCIMPPESATGSYVLQNITSNPKLTNFRWVSDATVDRTDLQTRPTGVERWNEIETAEGLEDLKFTKCYTAPTRLSEFIGLNETTKESTDAELLEVYNIAAAAYQSRSRDGQLWQTVHSVVYGETTEHLWCQENWDVDYIAAKGEAPTYTAGDNITIVDNVISATDTTYSKGTGIQITGTTIEVDTAYVATRYDLSTKQDTLTAGTNITIVDNVISASGGGASYTAGDNIDITNNVISVDSELSDAVDENTTALGGQTLLKLTQAEYDAITDKDPNTIYIISDGTPSSVGIASASQLGSIRVGTNLTIDSETGVLSATGGGTTYTAGDNIDITNDVISVDSDLSDAVDANTTALGGQTLLKLTQAEYDAITDKDPNTVYIISDGTPSSVGIASASQLGSIKVGSGLSIDATTGVLSATGGGGGAEIDDDNPSLTTVYSSSKVEALISALNVRVTALENSSDGGEIVPQA